MENSLRNIIEKNNIKCKKITIKNNIRIIEDTTNRVVIKKKNNTNLKEVYNYLLSRYFDYFPHIIDENNEYVMYEYLEENITPNEQKASDIINLLTILHSKTTYYKELDYDYYKKIYEDNIEEVNNLYNYYNDLINIINKEVYMSPSNYLIARNISLVYKMLNYCQENIDKWYELIKNKAKLRVVNLHNNIKIEHFIKADKPYFISWDKTKIDSPIYDLLSFYKNHYLDFDFKELFLQYEKGYPLLEEERILLFILIAKPKKIEIYKNEYTLCKYLSKYFDNLYKAYGLINSYKIKKH